MEFLTTFFLVIFFINSILLILLVLIQNNDSDGISSVFGGSSMGHLGITTGNILTKSTVILGMLFFVLAFILAYLNRTVNLDEGVISTAREIELEQNNDIVKWWEKDNSVNENQDAENIDNKNIKDANANLETDEDLEIEDLIKIDDASKDKPSSAIVDTVDNKEITE